MIIGLEIVAVVVLLLAILGFVGFTGDLGWRSPRQRDGGADSRRVPSFFIPQSECYPAARQVGPV